MYYFLDIFWWRVRHRLSNSGVNIDNCKLTTLDILSNTSIFFNDFCIETLCFVCLPVMSGQDFSATVSVDSIIIAASHTISNSLFHMFLQCNFCLSGHFLAILFSHVGFHTPRYFKTIWLCNLLFIESNSRNASGALNLKSVCSFFSFIFFCFVCCTLS